MIGLKLAWQGYWQAFSSSDHRIVSWTQILLIFFIVTLTLTSASIQQFLDDNLNNMLGSDMVVASYTKLTPEQEAPLSQLSTNLSRTQTLSVTLTNKENWQQVKLKLIDKNYPVQGMVSIAPSLYEQHLEVNHGPPIGEIWIDSRLVTKLNLTVGQSMKIGDTALELSAIIFHEPDRIMEGHSVALRAMVNYQSFTAAARDQQFKTGNSHFRYLINAEESDRQQIETIVDKNFPEARVIIRDGGQHPLAKFWQRVENFIGLASVLLFLMAAIAIDLASRRQLAKQKYKQAIYLSMGMKKRQGMLMAIFFWLFGFVFSLIPATLLAYGAEWVAISQLSAQFPGIKFDWHLSDLVNTWLLVFILLLSFQVPSLIQLTQTSVISLIRKQQQGRYLLARLVWNFTGLAILAALYSDNGLLTAMTLGAMFSSLFLMMLVTYSLLTIGEKLSRGLSGLLPFTFFMMKQRLLSKSTQILGIGLCATLLLFTLMLMKDIGAVMENQIRTHDGNLLITQAKSNHINAIENWSEKNNSKINQLKPYTKAQLVNVNDLSLTDFSGKPSDSMATLEKPIRLSWSETIPSNNSVNQGHWWSENDTNFQQISVESEVMTDVGLSIGDRLVFQIGGETIEFTIVASHDFKSGFGSITFWFQVPASIVEKLKPETYFMGSMELPNEAWSQLVQLWQEFPTLTLMPLKEITERFDATLAIMQKLVVGFCSMIILMALVVVVASVKGFERDDQKKNGLLLSMGVNRMGILKLSFYEWLITALIAGIGAVGGTWVAGILIYQSQFSLTYSPDPLWVMVTLIITGLVICSVGLFYCRNSLRATVNQLMTS